MYRVRMVALAVLQATVGQREFIAYRGWHLGRQGRCRRRPPSQVQRLTAPYSQRLQNGRFRRHWYVERRCGRVWRRYGRVWRRRRSVSHDATPRGRITTQNMYFHPFAQAAFIVPCGSMGMSPGSGFRSNVRPPTCHAHSRHLLTMHQPPTHQSTSSFMFFSPNDLTDRTPPTWAQCACRRALARGAVILPATLGPEP